jgi:peptide/nickel transport system substrate-binding protein
MLTRRTLLAASAAGPFAANAVVPSADAATPKDVVVMAKQIDDIINGFDPAECYEGSDVEGDGNIYRRLVVPDDKDHSKVVGDLAQSWTVSPDGTTFTFRLGSKSFFPSGKAVTAEDAAFSLQRVVKLNKPPGFIITQFGFTKDNVDQLIRATDAHTLEMKLPTAQATSFVLFCLSANVGSVVERATALAHEQNGDLGNGWLKTHSAGTGPYQLTSWAASDHVILNINPHSGMPAHAKKIIIRHVTDPSAQLLMLRKGDVDIARNLTPDQLKLVAKSEEFRITSTGQGASMYIAMNQAVPELSKPQVRQAIKWAIDYDAIAKNITPNTWKVAQAFLPSGLPGALTDEPFHKDVAKARALLAEAGLPNGFSVTLDYNSAPPYSDIAQKLQADLAEIGIKVSLIGGENKQVVTKSRARQHQLVMKVWGTDYFDPNSNAQTFCEDPDDGDGTKLKSMAWQSHYQDKELTDMADQAAKELDGAKRIAMYQKMQRLSQERGPFVFMLQQVETAVMGKGVSGFTIGAISDYTRYAGVKKA